MIMDKINKFIDWLINGEWSRQKHKNAYHDKFDRDIDIFVDYISQVPYFKLIGSPIAFLIIIGMWSPLILGFLREREGRQILKSLFKKNSVK